MNVETESTEKVRINKRRHSPMQPVLMAVLLVLGMLIGSYFREGTGLPGVQYTGMNAASLKLVSILQYIDQNYVDTVDEGPLVNKAIAALLEGLDPHSYYISSEEMAEFQEPLEGNFEGIGVEFMIQRDTLVVVTPIQGGPSEQVGIQPGDRIVTVDGENIAGVGITNQKVVKLLKGAKGTMVKLGIARRQQKELLTYEVERAEIPIYSVVASFVVEADLGYIKVSRFARNTYEEFMEAMQTVSAEGAKKVVIDLRGNGGGYMRPATQMVEAFLNTGQLIVYTEGKASPRDEIYSSRPGKYRDMEVILLIDQGSASASEIMAGALQDHDRALLIGRRSFGKGLVQNEIPLPDGSAIRLTVSRYYTPTGRCIQKPYGDGVDYSNDLTERFESGELMSQDSIVLTDSLKYITPSGRVVYGGGGITPDIFVPIDTLGASYYLSELSYSGAIREFAFDYVEKHGAEMSAYKDWAQFINSYRPSDAMIEGLSNYAEKQGVLKDADGLTASKEVIRLRIKAYVGRDLFGENMYYRVLLEDDVVFKKAQEIGEGAEPLSSILSDSNK